MSVRHFGSIADWSDSRPKWPPLPAFSSKKKGSKLNFWGLGWPSRTLSSWQRYLPHYKSRPNDSTVPTTIARIYRDYRESIPEIEFFYQRTGILPSSSTDTYRSIHHRHSNRVIIHRRGRSESPTHLFHARPTRTGRNFPINYQRSLVSRSIHFWMTSFTSSIEYVFRELG